MKTPNPTPARDSAAPPVSVKADQITFTDDGHAWWVVAAHKRLDSESGLFEWLAPHDLVQLDRECSAAHCNQGHDMRVDDGHSRRCSDCIDGRHTFTLTQLCVDLNPDECPGDCNEGCYEHRVSIVEGMVLPIYNSIPDGACLVMYRDERSPRAFDTGGRNEATNLPSAAEPGMWAVKLRVA